MIGDSMSIAPIVLPADVANSTAWSDFLDDTPAITASSAGRREVAESSGQYVKMGSVGRVLEELCGSAVDPAPDPTNQPLSSTSA